MKKTLIIAGSILLLIIISFTVYWNLPIEVTRGSDIESGNRIIQNIEAYQKSNGRLPQDNDWKTLKKLGFKQEYLGVRPDYTTDNKSYELAYLEDFDGPYLIWNSQERKWTIDFPKIYK